MGTFIFALTLWLSIWPHISDLCKEWQHLQDLSWRYPKGGESWRGIDPESLPPCPTPPTPQERAERALKHRPQDMFGHFEQLPANQTNIEKVRALFNANQYSLVWDFHTHERARRWLQARAYERQPALIFEAVQDLNNEDACKAMDLLVKVHPRAAHEALLNQRKRSKDWADSPYVLLWLYQSATNEQRPPWRERLQRLFFKNDCDERDEIFSAMTEKGRKEMTLWLLKAIQSRRFQVFAQQFQDLSKAWQELLAYEIDEGPKELRSAILKSLTRVKLKQQQPSFRQWLVSQILKNAEQIEGFNDQKLMALLRLAPVKEGLTRVLKVCEGGEPAAWEAFQCLFEYLPQNDPRVPPMLLKRARFYASQTKMQTLTEEQAQAFIDSQSFNGQEVVGFIEAALKQPSKPGLGSFLGRWILTTQTVRAPWLPALLSKIKSLKKQGRKAKVYKALVYDQMDAQTLPVFIEWLRGDSLKGHDLTKALKKVEVKLIRALENQWRDLKQQQCWRAALLAVLTQDQGWASRLFKNGSSLRRELLLRMAIIRGWSGLVAVCGPSIRTASSTVRAAMKDYLFTFEDREAADVLSQGLVQLKDTAVVDLSVRVRRELFQKNGCTNSFMLFQIGAFESEYSALVVRVWPKRVTISHINVSDAKTELPAFSQREIPQKQWRAFEQWLKTCQWQRRPDFDHPGVLDGRFLRFVHIQKSGFQSLSLNNPTSPIYSRRQLAHRLEAIRARFYGRLVNDFEALTPAVPSLLEQSVKAIAGAKFVVHTKAFQPHWVTVTKAGHLLVQSLETEAERTLIGQRWSAPRAMKDEDLKACVPEIEDFEYNRENHPSWKATSGSARILSGCRASGEGYAALWSYSQKGLTTCFETESYWPVVSSQGRYVLCIAWPEEGSEQLLLFDRKLQKAVAKQPLNGRKLRPHLYIPELQAFLVVEWTREVDAVEDFASDINGFLFSVKTRTLTPLPQSASCLFHAFERPHQRVKGRDALWVAMSDAKTQSTAFGQFSFKTMRFHVTQRFKGLEFTSRRLWVDEGKKRILVATKGSLLSLALK